ncbi:MAG: hypothetical protein ACODAU_02155 [Myxococcota bacterium]
MRVWPVLAVAALGGLVGGCGGSGPPSCGRDADCDAGEVCGARPGQSPEDAEPLRLACGAPLEAAPPGDFCRSGDECDHGICLLAGTCVAPCEADEDCGDGLRCREAFARTGPESLQPVGACVSAVDAPPEVAVDTRVLSAALTGGSSADALSFGAGVPVTERLVAVLEPSRPVDAWVQSMSTRDPDPVLLYDLAGSTVVRRNPPTPYGEPMSVLLPNGPDAVLTEAGYEMRVRSDATSMRPADVFVAELARGDLGTVMDLDLFYVGVEEPASADGPVPAYVADALARVDDIFAPAGIRVGDVRQHLVVGALRDDLEVIELDREASVPDLVDLPQLFRLSAGTGRPSVPVFLVRLVEGALGISGGVPGPHGMHGTMGSGIAVSVGPLRIGVGSEDGIDLGRVLAHELGHFMGLFHTTEPDGFSLEPLSDTPECPEDQDRDGDGNLTGSECQEFDADNLMFWAATGETLSEQQDEVLGSGAVLR